MARQSKGQLQTLPQPVHSHATSNAQLTWPGGAVLSSPTSKRTSPSLTVMVSYRKLKDQLSLDPNILSSTRHGDGTTRSPSSKWNAT